MVLYKYIFIDNVIGESYTYFKKTVKYSVLSTFGKSKRGKVFKKNYKPVKT